MSVDKGKVSSAAAEDHEAISTILDQPLATRFLDDPIINGLCDRLAEHQPLVKTAQQLLKALRGSKVLEDGNLNDDALKHFALLLKTWRCKHFRSGINEIIHQSECVLPAVIEELSDGVTSEKIEERMCRIKGDQNLGHILEVANPPATMIRGLLIVVIGYWSYKKLPVEEMCDILEDDECDVVEDKVDNVGGDVLDERLMLEREEHNEWLMKYGSPVQKLDQEPAIEELADDLEKDPRLSEKAQQCMAFLLNYDPDDDDTLIFAKGHCDLAHEVLEDSHFIQLLFERIKTDTEARCFVSESGQRVKVRTEDDALATINGIIGDPGLQCYKKRIENNEVGRALRVFLSIVILHWMHKDVYEKVSQKLKEYGLAQLKEYTDYKDAIARDNDNIKGVLRYSTRFAGDVKDLKLALDALYGGKPYGHIFSRLRIAQYGEEIYCRRRHYDVEIDFEVHMSKGVCIWTTLKVRRN